MWAALDDDVAAEDELNCAALDCAGLDNCVALDCAIVVEGRVALEDCTELEDGALSEEDCAMDDEDCLVVEDELNGAALDNCALADEDCTIMADEDRAIADEDCAIVEEDCAKLAESLMARIGEMVCCLTESANGFMRVKRLSGEPSEWAIEKAPKNAMINKILRYML